MNHFDKIKILYVLPQLIIGGAEKQVLETIMYLDRNIYEVYVCSLSRDKMSLKEQFISAGARVIDIHKRSKYDLAIVWRLSRFLRQHRIAIVHSYLNNVWARIAGILARTPVIIAAERSVDSWWKSSFHLFVDSVLERFTDHILVNSEAVRNYYAKHLRFANNGKIKVIYNGIDVNRYANGIPPEAMKQQLGIDGNQITVGIVASLKEVKDHWTFFRAARLILDQVSNVTFVIIGDGELRERLQEFTKQLDIQDQVRFLGLRNDIAELMAGIDISVLSSIQEGFSNSILEAMAASKPMVATDVGGNAEAVVDGETGYIVPSGREDLLADALLEFIRDERKRSEFGERGLKRVNEHFGREDRFLELHELYVQSLQLNGKYTMKQERSQWQNV
ncbi:glycosyltransferase [Cohnella sp. WQ 127256]|uniref:glycosyltransferase n=1 Tax=Cohnella sp. WQ 127256 TaxID=2938790 RepID=UPI002118FCE4|nr:glycosyltransferase [Cohnella sp. WQ 127256]